MYGKEVRGGWRRRGGYLGYVFREDTDKMGGDFRRQLTEGETVAGGKASFQVEPGALGIVRSSPRRGKDDQIYRQRKRRGGGRLKEGL